MAQRVRDDQDARNPGGEKARHCGKPEPLACAVPGPGSNQDRGGRRDGELPDADSENADCDGGDKSHSPALALEPHRPQQQT